MLAGGVEFARVAVGSLKHPRRCRGLCRDRSHEHQDVDVEHLLTKGGPASPEDALGGSEQSVRDCHDREDGDQARHLVGLMCDRAAGRARVEQTAPTRPLR
jgi:hypothetical protein